MAVLTDQQATLNQGEETQLFFARFTPCRVTLTGASGEFQTVPMRVKRQFGRTTIFTERSEIKLRFIETLFGARIVATAPAGVATLDIVYEVGTRGDA
jgi:hypothetical protein